MKTSNLKNSLLIAAILWLPLCLHAQGIRIERGTNMVMNDGVRLMLQDASFLNNGNFTAAKSTVIFTSDASGKVVFAGGSSATAFNNLVIDRPSSLLQLQNHISISGSLALQRGNLELNCYRLDLGRTGVIDGENINAYISGHKGGTVVITTELNAPHNLNPGNIGIYLTGSADFGATTITRGHMQQVNARGQQSIQRYFNVQPAFNGAISVQFHYLETELAGNKESELVLWSNTDGSAWTAIGKENSDVTNNGILKNNVSAMSRFTSGIASGEAFSLMNSKRAGPQSVLQAYPNPARDKFTLVVFTERESTGIVSLQDHQGRVLERRQMNYRKGMNTIQWKIDNYAAGTYFVVFDDSVLSNVKIVKQ